MRAEHTKGWSFTSEYYDQSKAYKKDHEQRPRMRLHHGKHPLSLGGSTRPRPRDRFPSHATPNPTARAMSKLHTTMCFCIQ